MKNPKTITGRGIVGNWLSPKGKLGGMLPAYLIDKNNSIKECIRVASKTRRFQKFNNDDVEFWYCEIVIKPIKKVKGLPIVEENYF